jgi:predicted RNA-binding protein with PIN domain
MTAGDGPEGAVPVTPMPETVRRELVAYAAEALGFLELDEVPVPLRRIRAFTPAKRARLGAQALARTVASDAAFRSAVHRDLRARHPDLVAGVTGDGATELPPARAAAIAYLAGSEAWPSLAEIAEREEHRRTTEQLGAATQEQLQRLQEQLVASRETAIESVRAAEAETDAVRAQLDDLKRRTRRNSDRIRRAEEELAAARADADRVRAEADAAAESAAAELRRLRARVTHLEAAAESTRRGAREARTVDDVRLGTLLDVLASVSAGIRRELALPPTAGSPSDLVAAALAAGEAQALAQVDKGVPRDAPALLDRVLAMPGLHLIVDGYNVTKTGFGTLPLEAQRARLLAGLGALAARYPGVEVTCVFDGAEARVRPTAVPTPRGVRVLFSPVGEIADTVIVSLTEHEPTGRPVAVVTSDQAVVDGVRKRGAHAVPSTALLGWLGR